MTGPSLSSPRALDELEPQDELEFTDSASRHQALEPWRERALARAKQLKGLAAWARIATDEPEAEADVLMANIRSHLDAAIRAAHGKRGQRPLARDALVERTTANLDAAESDIFRLAPKAWVRAQIPALLARARAYLSTDDPRRIQIEDIAAQRPEGALSELERDYLIVVLEAASLQRRDELGKVRELRNILIVPLVLLTLAALGFAVIGFSRPELLPLCFATGDTVACPAAVRSLPSGVSQDQVSAASLSELDQIARATASAWDILLVEIIGVIAASVAAATALRGFRRKASPYDFPLLLTLLKLPSGAVTAVLGLLLIRAEFIPGLSTLDSATQIVAWAIIFGYSQQLFTRFVDQRAEAVLDAVEGIAPKGRSADLSDESSRARQR